MEGVEVHRVERLGQLTGSVGPSFPEPRDPEGHPLLNETGQWGMRGVDLGATVEHGGRLFVFFGDSFDPPHGDPVCWSDLTVVADGGIPLQAVLGGDGLFHPLTIDDPIGILGINETPTGAFSHAGRAFVFVWVGQRPGGPPAGSYLVSTPDPSSAAPYRVERQVSPLRFDSCGYWQVAPVVVDNGAHPELPTSEGRGVVMASHGFDVSLGSDGIHLAWISLEEQDPASAPIQYAAPLGGRLGWSPREQDARSLFPQPGYTAVSLGWVEPAQRWILLYSKAGLADPGAGLPDRRDGPIVARVGTSLSEWSDEVAIFDPVRDHATGRWLHRPGLDELHHYPPGMDRPGWSYGAFLVEHLTRWDPDSRHLELTYLLSTFSPYQVQLMRTTLLVAP
jgi:hypothetical protein